MNNILRQLTIQLNDKARIFIKLLKVTNVMYVHINSKTIKMIFINVK